MHDKNDKILFSFWIYLMTDLIMFAVLFAVYAVLRGNTFGGPAERELLSLPGVLLETMLLLTSSFTVGLAMLAAYEGNVRRVLTWFSTTFILGAAFLIFEINEFAHLINEGHDWTKSASLSSFFALVGTHGLHITIGLLWLVIAMAMVISRGITPFIMSKLARFALFWHFLDIVWIFIFTIVYLMAHA